MKRRTSIDAFRGFTIIMMILVNSPGSWDHVYNPLLHAEWNGCTPADLVFPFFIFIVGVSVVFAFSKYMDSGIDKSFLLKKSAIRTLIIFFTGICLNILMAQFSELRIPGVLQRIAIVYFICAVLFLYFTPAMILAISAIILTGYWVLLIAVPPPGQEEALLLPGMNIVNWIDSQVIPFKMYRGTWDPEGLLSTLPAIVTGTSGIFAGLIMRNQKFTEQRKINAMIIAGVIFIVLGLVWNNYLPFNKNLWTSSYVLYTSGLAFLLLALFEITRKGRWQLIFIVPGMNAIIVYILHILFIFPFAYLSFSNFQDIQTEFMRTLMNSGIRAELASLLWAFLYTAICLTPAWILYGRKIFIKI